MQHATDVLIVGAGPAGSCAAALLARRGRKVAVLERERFPRFSIGESLLPQSMAFLEEAGLLRRVVEAGFQHKNGAAFSHMGRSTAFDFREKSSPGWGTTYQVPRASFDALLADGAAEAGALLRFGTTVTSVAVGPEGARVASEGPDGPETWSARLVLDASGNAKVLPKLLGLVRPSDLPVRAAYFTHLADRIPAGAGHDRQKILITVHPRRRDVWYWLIPFSDGRASVGVVGPPDFLRAQGADPTAALRSLHDQDPRLRELLAEADWDLPARELAGYSSNVSATHGPGFALLGNAAEFLDPVFSSGVTIALHSASLAARLAERTLDGGAPDWERDFAQPLRRGVDTFRKFVEAWYDGSFQDVLFHPDPDPGIRRYLCSILAGYAWDGANPYVAEPRRLDVLASLCRGA